MLTYDFRLPPGPRTVEYALLAEDLADRVKTRCSAATSILAVTKDHKRHRVTPQIAPIDRVGALSEVP